jgi:hypothetical protein
VATSLSGFSENSSNEAVYSQGQNHSLRYATHQLIIPIGIVASNDHKIGIVKSAINPSTINVAQNTLRSIPLFYAANHCTAVSRNANFENKHIAALPQSNAAR